MKIAVLFVAHKYNESSIIGYNRLVNELDNNIYDVVWCVPFDVKVDDESINVYRYGNTFVKRDGFYNPSFILERFYIEYKNYNYYYIHEYDVSYNGNYKDIFDKLDNYNNADLICAYVQKKTDKIYWQWWNTFKSKTDKLYPNYTLLKSCLSFCRLSNTALNLITSYSEKRNDVIYELYYPTICYHHGLKINSLDDNISDVEFRNNYNYCHRNYFWFSVNINAKYNNGKLESSVNIPHNILVTKIDLIK